MTNEKQFHLPISSYDVIDKMLHAYSLAGNKELSYKDIASKAGLSSTISSGNHKFLTSLGIISEGRKKKLIGPGKGLGVAISNKIDEDISKEWKKIILSSPETKGVLDMIKIKVNISEADLPNRIASTLSKNIGDRRTKSGIKCLVSIFEKAEILEKANGMYSLAPDWDKVDSTAVEAIAKEPETVVTPPEKSSGLISPEPAPSLQNVYPSLHIDVQVHISADARPEQIDQIFESMAKHLYNRG